MGLAPSSAFQSAGQAFLHGIANVGIFLGKSVLTAFSIGLASPLLPVSLASWGKTAYELIRDPTNPDHMKVAGLDTIVDVGKDIVEGIAGPSVSTVVNPMIDGVHAAINHAVKKKYADEAPGVVPPSELMKITDPEVRFARATSQRPHSVANTYVMQRGARADVQLISGNVPVQSVAN